VIYLRIAIRMQGGALVLSVGARQHGGALPGILLALSVSVLWWIVGGSL
jgi:hypothetical protein